MAKTRDKVTLADVARWAGVSQSAVSSVLSGKCSTISVSDDTRARILRASAELNYTPNILAQSLATRKSYLLGLICRENYAHMILHIVRGIQDVLNDSNYSLITYFHGDSLTGEAIHLKKSIERQVDGLIVMPTMGTDGEVNAEAFLPLVADGLPVVQLIDHLFAGVPVIQTNYRASGYMACRHLIELGHRRIVHFTHQSYCDSLIPGAYFNAIERWRGYESAMIESGLQPVVITHPGLGGGLKSFEQAYPVAQSVVDHHSKPTAVVAFNDYEAIGLVRGFIELGLRVPDDISVTGFDDQEASSTSIVPLTTLREPARLMGQAAAKMVNELIDGKEVHDLIFQPEIIVRASTSSPRS